MTHSERRIWLIDYLRNEAGEKDDMKIPLDEQKQKDMLRAFMNVREPKPISDEFIRIQDEYLSTENENAGITDVEDLTPFGKDERIILWQGDITTLRADAIVNAANSQMLGCFIPLHNCIDNAIHSKSGVQLRLKCKELMDKQGYEEPVGGAKITPGYNLPCEYIIHTVGPMVSDELEDEHKEQLARSYRTCLEVADIYELKSIVFCCISTGVFGFPNKEAAKIAVSTVRDYLKNTKTTLEKVVFNVFKDEDREIYTYLLGR
ncbi:MAG: protein-ADP-ribose hydrolase [Lachnospiraceae bacterium]|nr:protein-ADP-ribose hydrolase [Lachnospiraceae bacterium]